MKFQLVCVKPGSGDTETWFFDNQTNKIVGENGRTYYFWNDPRFFGVEDRFQSVPARVYDEEHPIRENFRVLSKLKIQLGLACNCDCTYCQQKRWRNPTEIQADEIDIVRFFDSFERTGLCLRKQGTIELWGGEPLVYRKVLLLLLPMLREKFGTEARIVMFTNGELLTKAMVDILMQYRVTVRISHDGPAQSLRTRKDPLDDPSCRQVWQYLLEESASRGIPMEFHAVITPRNANLQELQTFFKERFSPDVRVSFEGVATIDDVELKDCVFGSDDARTLVASIFNATLNELVPGIRPWVDELLGRLVHRVPVVTLGTACDAANPGVLSVDLFGRVLSCQNRSAQRFAIGSLDDYEGIVNPHLKHWSVYPACRDCLVLSSCKGGCPHHDSKDATSNCANAFTFHFGIFATVWFLLTERLIVEVRPLEVATENPHV